MYLLTLCIIVLLPIVPAYLLFKVLPSTAAVEGPLKGMEIKLGGAFAGYFALVLLIIYTAPIWHPPQPYEVWTVDGQVVDADGSSLQQPFDPVDLSSLPPLVQFAPNGSFKMLFAAVPDQTGNVVYPILVLGHKEHGSVTIPLDPSKSDEIKGVRLTRDSLKRTINLHVIPLPKLPPYSATGTPPQRVAPVQEPKQ